MTIVLLPGMDGTGLLFASFIAALGKEFNVQIVRYPTIGALGYAELEEFVRKSLPTSGRFVILGESFSGPIAISIAASQPAGLVGLILCCTFMRNPRPLFASLRPLINMFPVKLVPLTLFNTVLLGRFSTPQLRSALASAMSQVSAEALRARLHAVLSTDNSAKLKVVDVPLLYLLARHDKVVPVSALRQIKRALPTTQVESLNAPHFLLQATPLEAAVLVSNFMRKLQHKF